MRHKTLLVATAVAATAAVAGAWWSCARRPNLERDAETIVNAILAGDADTYFEFVSDVEKERFGLTREKTRKLFEKIVRPAFAGFRPVGEPHKGSYGPHQAYYHIMTQDAQGRRFELAASPFLGEERGVVPLSNVIIGPWILDFVVKKDLPVTSATSFYARTLGVRRDREFLTSLGIHGVVNIMDPSVFNDWDTYLQWIQRLCRGQFAEELRALGVRVEPEAP